MDWTTISIAVAAFGVVTFLIGYRFGGVAAYINGYSLGFSDAEKVCLKAIDNYTKTMEKVEKMEVEKVNLTQQDIDYLLANIATLNRMIGECGPEDEISKKSMIEQRDSLQWVLDQDKKEKSNV